MTSLTSRLSLPRATNSDNANAYLITALAAALNILDDAIVLPGTSDISETAGTITFAMNGDVLFNLPASKRVTFMLDSTARFLILETGQIAALVSALTVTDGGDSTVITPDRFRAPLRTPASAGATGTAGDISWDANYIYICTATNTWKRVAISTW